MEQEELLKELRDTEAKIAEEEKRAPGRVTDTENGIIAQKETVPRKKLKPINGIDFIGKDLPPTEYVVDIILAKGLVILSAKSKIGKSWLALDLALCVASGCDFLGFNTTQGKVLYIDLENTPSLAQGRMRTLLNGKDAPKDFEILNDFSTMNDYFEEDLRELLTKKKYSLVIVDVLQKVKKQKKLGQSDYEADYETMTTLKKIADEFNIALILVHHNRKMTNDLDPFENLLGSTALMGASDEVIVLHKKDRRDKAATMSISGRTVVENNYMVQFNKPLCKWEMLGDAEEIRKKQEKDDYCKDPIVKTIIRLVDQGKGKWQGHSSDIIKNSEYFKGCRIYDSAQKVGKKLKKLIPKLEEYDAITYHAKSHGNTSAEHCFEKIFS